jgi:hypothetical protein
MPSHFLDPSEALPPAGPPGFLPPSERWIEPLFRSLYSGVLIKIFGAPAQAETRGTDAALGALSGALVFGPVGAVVGFTAGSAIGNSWGVNGNSRARYRARTRSRQTQSRATADQAAPIARPLARRSDPSRERPSLIRAGEDADAACESACCTGQGAAGARFRIDLGDESRRRRVRRSQQDCR